MSKASIAASNEAYEIVQGVIDSVLEGIRAGEVTEDDLSDRIFSEVDNALTYTHTHYACVWGLPDAEDAIEEGFCSEPANFGAVLAVQAFCNLRAAVDAHDFTDAFAVAEDAALERGTP